MHLLHCMPHLPARGLITSCWTFAKISQLVPYFCSYLPLIFLLTRYFHFLLLSALFETSAGLHPLHKEVDILGWTNGCLHVALTLRWKPHPHTFHVGTEKLAGFHSESSLICCSLRLLSLSQALLPSWNSKPSTPASSSASQFPLSRPTFPSCGTLTPQELISSST